MTLVGNRTGPARHTFGTGVASVVVRGLRLAILEICPARDNGSAA
jgi:hypothetical protein